jgi:hypothetical protein
MRTLAVMTRVHHFLASHYALANIALRRIRLSRYADLNDPFELLAASTADKSFRSAMMRNKEHSHKTQGLLCFSRAWSNPVLWSHYADKHRGMVLSFDISDKHVIPISYATERLQVEFTDGDPAKGVSEPFVLKLVSTKFEHWRYEDEIRLAYRLDEATVENGSYFVAFDSQLILREVVLGPMCEAPVEEVRSLVQNLYKGVAVRKARLAFKTYEVVPDQRYEGK